MNPLLRPRIVHRHRPISDGVDVIGDVHGCHDELLALVMRLGWTLKLRPDGTIKHATPPTTGRRLLFVGDLIDKGPASLETLRSVRALCALDLADVARGNHEAKLAQSMRKHGLRPAHDTTEETPEDASARRHPHRAPRPHVARLLDQLRTAVDHDEGQWARWMDFLDELPYTITYTPATSTPLVVVHAGVPYPMRQDVSAVARQHCTYGEVIGWTETRRPIHGDTWTASWPLNGPTVVHGHVVQRDGRTPTPRGVAWNLDTGCVYGGALTALRWPEMAIVHVPAARAYYSAADDDLALSHVATRHMDFEPRETAAHTPHARSGERARSE